MSRESGFPEDDEPSREPTARSQAEASEPFSETPLEPLEEYGEEAAFFESPAIDEADEAPPRAPPLVQRTPRGVVASYADDAPSGRCSYLSAATYPDDAPVTAEELVAIISEATSQDTIPPDDVNEFAAHVATLTGQEAPATLKKKRAFIANWYTSQAPPVGPRTPRKSPAAAAPAPAQPAVPIDAYDRPELAPDKETLLREVASHGAQIPSAALSALATAIERLDGSKAPFKLNQRRTFIEDWFVANGGGRAAAAAAKGRDGRCGVPDGLQGPRRPPAAAGDDGGPRSRGAGARRVHGAEPARPGRAPREKGQARVDLRQGRRHGRDPERGQEPVEEAPVRRAPRAPGLTCPLNN